MSKLNLKPIEGISLDKLLLDPNNPRFADGFLDEEPIADSDVENKQAEILNHFKGFDSISGEDSEDFRYGLDELMKSMWSIGFVPIDQIVVRKMEASDKYLVIEGNRRVSAAKLVLKEHYRLIEEGRTPLSEEDHDKMVAEGISPNKRVLSGSRVRSLENIRANELLKNDLSDEEYNEQIRIILGVRHHGSLLEWDALPKAYNIYQEYMRIDPELSSFEWQPKRSNRVVSIFSLGDKSPKRALRAYVAFNQLTESGFEIKPHHFSLLETIVCNTKITGSAENSYLQVDQNSFELTDVAMSKIDMICQFKERDNIMEDEETILANPNQFKILRDPKSVKDFAKIIISTRDPNDGIRSFALTLLQQVEEREIPLNGLPYHPKANAINELTNFINQVVWVDKVEALLKRTDELKISEFGDSPNDIMRLTELDDTMNTVFRPVFIMRNNGNANE